MILEACSSILTLALKYIEALSGCMSGLIMPRMEVGFSSPLKYLRVPM